MTALLSPSLVPVFQAAFIGLLLALILIPLCKLIAVRTGVVAPELGGTADVVFGAGGLEWQSGAMTGTGRTVVAANGRLDLTGSATKTVSRTIDAVGLVSWRGGNVDLVNGTFNNRNFLSIDTTAGAVRMTNSWPTLIRFGSPMLLSSMMLAVVVLYAAAMSPRRSPDLTV